MYQLCCDAYVHKQGGSGCRLGRARYGTCCALNKLLLLSRVKYHQIGFDIGAATQKGAIINKPCGVMASIYRHRSQMARLNGSSGAAAAAHKLSLRCTIYMYTGARACLRSVAQSRAKRALSIKRWLYHIKSAWTRALAVDTAAHSAHTQCVRCGNMQNQCAAAWSMTHIIIYFSNLDRCKCITINLLIAEKTRIMTWLFVGESY
jgi:hypothetical protein